MAARLGSWRIDSEFRPLHVGLQYLNMASVALGGPEGRDSILTG